MPKRKSTYRRRSYRSRSSLSTTLRKPIVQVGILVVVGLIIFLIASLGNEQANKAGVLPASISVDKAYQMYQDGTFVLDVRTPEEWNDFHAPNTTLIPLDELANRCKRTAQGPADFGCLPLGQPQPGRARYSITSRVQRHQYGRRLECLERQRISSCQRAVKLLYISNAKQHKFQIFVLLFS